MDEKDPTVCRQFEASDSDDFVLEAAVISVAVVLSALLVAGVIESRRRQLLKRQPLDEEAERDEIHEIEKMTESDNRRVVACRLIIFCMLIAAGIALPIIVNGLLKSRESDEFEAMVRTWLGAIQGKLARKQHSLTFLFSSVLLCRCRYQEHGRCSQRTGLSVGPDSGKHSGISQSGRGKCVAKHQPEQSRSILSARDRTS